jgi:hypothetical protein
MSISIPLVYKLIIHQEVQMFTKPVTRQVQWQDFKVLNEADTVLKIAHQNGWKDCKIFGHGDMLTQPRESMGWKLIPADLYEYSIPAVGVSRILQILNAGVRIQGVIIADDLRKKNSPHIPAKPTASRPSTGSVFSMIGKIVLGLISIAGSLMIGIAVVGFVTVFSFLLLMGVGMMLDPQLIILVDDGNGGTAWVSVLTWFE